MALDMMDAVSYEGAVDWGWRPAAACKGSDTEAFFQPKNYPDLKETFCDSCIVRKQCLFTALITHSEGFMGGKDEDERQEFFERLKKAKLRKTHRLASQAWEAQRQLARDLIVAL